MPEVDLSTLSGAELRSLLDASRRRGQATQAYQILQEMEARRTPGRRGRRRPAAEAAADAETEADAEPRPMRLPSEVDLDRSFAPAPPLAPATDADAPDDAPSADHAASDDAGEPPLSLPPRERPPRKRPPRKRPARAAKPPRPPKPARGPRSAWPALTFAAGLVLGGAVGFAAASDGRFLAAQPPTAVFPEAPGLRAEQVPPPATPAPAALSVDAVPAPMDATPPAAEAAAPGEAAAASPTPAAEPEPPAPATALATAEPAPAPAAEPAKAASPQAACVAAAAAPADRVICGDVELRRLQRELQQAYAQALAAHEDRALLRQHQLEWRDARNAITDPQALAQLYEARIRKLNAAAAEARRTRSPT